MFLFESTVPSADTTALDRPLHPLDITALYDTDLTVSVSNTTTDVGSSTASAGTISVGEILLGTIDFAGDSDWYAIDLNFADRAKFSLSSNDYTLNFYDSTGAFLREGRVYFIGDNDDPYYFLDYPISVAGRYYVEVVGNGMRDLMGEEYSLTALAADAHGDYRVTATDVDLDTTIFARMDDPRDVDYFAFEAQAGSFFSIVISDLDNGTDVYARITDAVGNLFSFQQTDDAGVIIHFETATTATYLLRAHSQRFEGFEGQDYTVQTQATTDFVGSSISLSGELTVGEAVQGAFDYERDVDMYRISLEAGESYRVILDSNGISWVDLTGFSDSNGANFSAQIVELNADRVYFFTAEESGEYYLSFRGDVGDFRITTEVVGDDYGDIFADATQITGNTPIMGRMDAPDDIDVFSIEISEGDLWDITSSSRSAFISLRDADGNMVGSELGGQRAFLEDVDPGQYYIVITSNSLVGSPNVTDPYTLGFYTLNFERLFDDFGNDRDSAEAIFVGQSIDGTLYNNSDRDFFYIDAAAGDIVALSQDRLSGQSYRFSVLDSAGHTLATYSPGVVTLNFDTAGRYFFVFDNSTVDGVSYNFTYLSSTGTGVTDAVGNDNSTATPYDITGRPIESAIDYAGDTDWFEITVEARDRIQIDLTALSLNGANLAVANSFGQIMVVSGDSATDGSASLEWMFATAGTYYIVASAEGFTGTYRLSTELLRGPTEIAGDSTNDRIEGTISTEYIYGLDGDDVLIGGGGNDTLLGGSGADIFVIDYNIGRAVITDFSLAEDRIALDYGPYFDWDDIATRLSDGEFGAVLDMGGGSLFELWGVSVTDLNLSHFIIGFEDPDGIGPLRDDRYIFDWDDKAATGAKVLDNAAPVSQFIEWTDTHDNDASKAELMPDWLRVDDAFIL